MTSPERTPQATISPFLTASETASSSGPEFPMLGSILRINSGRDLQAKLIQSYGFYIYNYRLERFSK
jgi:hypothetical protein